MKMLMLLSLLVLASCVTLSPAERTNEVRDAHINHDKN